MKSRLKIGLLVALFCSIFLNIKAEVSQAEIIEAPRAMDPTNWDWTFILIVTSLILVLGIIIRLIALGSSAEKLNP
ncbi:hypothetical protein N9J24_01830 [Bacteroidia bacterium]|nr:hypothetical protein [Bacteroidia bacterium]